MRVAGGWYGDEGADLLQLFARERVFGSNAASFGMNNERNLFASMREARRKAQSRDTDGGLGMGLVTLEQFVANTSAGFNVG